MDILRKELNLIYRKQKLDDEILDQSVMGECKAMVSNCAAVDDNCRVITDVSCDKCYIYGGSITRVLGINGKESFFMMETNSSDEDIIYNRIHPEDLVEKRMLEYEFLKFVDNLATECKTRYIAVCRIRIKDYSGRYIYVDNSTQVMRTSPRGGIWLILCCYDLTPDQTVRDNISAYIVDLHSGEPKPVEFGFKRMQILTAREKEVLNLIKDGKASKHIAALLGISIHTVNRHRQNILGKLSVGNSTEAVMAATAMKLL